MRRELPRPRSSRWMCHLELGHTWPRVRGDRGFLASQLPQLWTRRKPEPKTRTQGARVCMGPARSRYGVHSRCSIRACQRSDGKGSWKGPPLLFRFLYGSLVPVGAEGHPLLTPCLNLSPDWAPPQGHVSSLLMKLPLHSCVLANVLPSAGIRDQVS